MLTLGEVWDDAVIGVHSTGYSGADMANVCREAAYGPVREAAKTIQHISADEVSCHSCLPEISLYITDKNVTEYTRAVHTFALGVPIQFANNSHDVHEQNHEHREH